MWEARPLAGAAPRPSPWHWGFWSQPTWGVWSHQMGRWVAFGSSERCLQMAAHLNEVDAILRRHAPLGPGAGGADA
jgi:hypothetical protein